MPVTERLMAAGQWSLSLDLATKKLIRDSLDFFGHVFVFDTPMRTGLSDATMIAASRWAGIVRTRMTPWSLGGVNMNAWLGDEDGKGYILETKVGAAGVNNAFNAYKTTIIAQINTVTSGTSTAPAGTTQAEYQWLTARAAFDSLATIFNIEYRVNKDASMDTAPVGQDPSTGGLFVQTPTAIVLRRTSGRDPNVTGIPVTQLDIPIDADSYISRAIVKDKTGAFTAQAGSAVSYNNLLGNTVRIAQVFDQSALTPNGSAAAQATNLVTAGQVLHQQVALSSDEYDITRDVKHGDWISVYDVDTNLTDTTNPVRYRGEILYPSKQRCMAVTWPIERGMGVWYRDKSAVWTDLTPYVLFEAPGVTLEIGASTRRLLAG